MAGESRRRLVDAGIELVVGQPWQDVHTSVSTRAITERAGVTTGSFFHHFRNRAHFAEALIEQFVERWDADTERLAAMISAVADRRIGEEMRVAADAHWAVITASDARHTIERLLWATRDRPLTDESSTTAGQVLGDRYRALTDALVPAYRRVQEALHREMLPPFTIEDLAVALAAVADGLQTRVAVDPDAVRPDLYADLITSLVIALTRPENERADATELAALEQQLTRPPPVSTGLADAPGGMWRQIAGAAVPLFAERPVADVRIADIAAAAGVSTSTVYHQFGTVSAVAAAGWASYVAELEEIAGRPYTAAEGPIVRIEQVLTRFIDLSRDHRGMLEGLMLEVLAETTSGTASGSGPVRYVGAMAGLLVPHVRELRARGLLRRRIDSEALAGSMLQLVAPRALSAQPAERIIDDTVGVLLDGALARPTD